MMMSSGSFASIRFVTHVFHSTLRRSAMRKLIAICAVAALFSANYAMADWVTLNMPGAVDTWATGISGTNIVGYGYDAGYTNPRTFLYDGTKSPADPTAWTTLTMTGATYTFAQGINGNNIVGNYQIGEGPGSSLHGFLYNGTTWTTLDVPGATCTSAQGINGNNIVGNYNDYFGVARGFLYDGTKSPTDPTAWTTLTMPGIGNVFPMSISGDNIVGMYPGEEGRPNCGFLYDLTKPMDDPTAWTILNVLDSTDTPVWGISGNNVVGYFNYPVDYKLEEIGYNGEARGFVYDITKSPTDPTAWTILNIGETDTCPLGIDGGNIVGVINDPQGFLYSIPEPGTLTMLAGSGLLLLLGVLRRRLF